MWELGAEQLEATWQSMHIIRTSISQRFKRVDSRDPGLDLLDVLDVKIQVLIMMMKTI